MEKSFQMAPKYISMNGTTSSTTEQIFGKFKHFSLNSYGIRKKDILLSTPSCATLAQGYLRISPSDLLAVAPQNDISPENFATCYIVTRNASLVTLKIYLL